MIATQQPVPHIDWDYFKTTIDHPTIVDQIRAEFEGREKPKYDGKAIRECEAQFEKLVADAEKIAVEADARIVEIDKELEELENDLDNLDEIDMDEVLEQDPKLKEEVEERIRNGKWF